MKSNVDLKRYRTLQDKKARGMAERFLVQGKKVVKELVESRFRTEVILASEEAAAFITPFAASRKIPVEIIAGHELDKIGTFEKGNELIGIAYTPESAPFRPARANELMLALDGIRDPRNLGSLVRIADWFGIDRLLLGHDCMELYNPKVVQSTMGSLFRVETRRTALAAELAQLRAGGAQILIADMDGVPIYDAVIERPAVLVLGSESHGHSRAVAELEATVVSIPRLGGAESLNVAMAAAALCTELARRLPRGLACRLGFPSGWRCRLANSLRALPAELSLRGSPCGALGTMRRRRFPV